MISKKAWQLILLGALFSPLLWAETQRQAVEASVRNQISALQTGTIDSNVSSVDSQTLSATLQFIEQTKKQKNDLAALEKQIQKLPQELLEIETRIKDYKDAVDSLKNSEFSGLSLDKLSQKQAEIQAQLQAVQVTLSDLDSRISNGRNLLLNNQKATEENVVRVQEITRLKNTHQANKSMMDRWNAELDYIDANNKFNALLTTNAEKLIELDEEKRSEATAQQQLLQKQLAVLQDVLNAKRLKESEQKALQVESQQVTSGIQNFLIQDELEHNRELSQFWVRQTQALNALSQDDLRTKNVLEGLAQAQRNIEEQISALQGTLVLSKVINQQMQALPTAKLNNDLATSIANVRVHIFEYSQQRDQLYNLDEYVRNITLALEEPLTYEENLALTKLLKERQKLLDDIIKSLNSQLNVSINIENNQKQIDAISSTLQRKLQQQSFWVNSNNPMGLDWIKAFPKLAFSEIAELTKYMSFSNVSKNLLPTALFTGFFLLISFLLNWKKKAIKDRLSKIASQVNTLKNDSHWYTPEAMFWTLLLALPSTLMFFTAYNLIAFLFFDDPISAWRWGVRLTLYWWFFATALSLLRPNGLAYRHFGMPQESNRIFQRIIKQSIWIIGLLLISSIPSQIEMIGYPNDVIGQVMSIVALALCLFVVRPLLDRGITEYQNAKTEDGTIRNVSLFKLLRLVLIVVPISLIVLIVFGYYYTAIYLITHLLNSYFVILIWVFGRYFAYRAVTISARRLAYRRLQEKRQKIREQAAEPSNKDEIKEEESIKLSVVNQQIFRITDLIGWVVLFGLLYVVWSDLISIAYYLDGVILFESNDGDKVEAITLLNLMRAFLYVVVTYALVKNIAGILEVILFSRIKLSKGTPQTITTVFIYTIVVIGGVSAFSALGISWTKIQWIFTALSVGLGFGVREIFGSVVSGSILLFERPIRVGDKVTVGQHTGFITKIRLRSTTLLNSDNMEVVLPNQAFVTDRFINWTLNNTITRLQFFLNVHLDDNLQKARELILQAIAEAPKVVAEPKPAINILRFHDNALEHEIEVFVGELGDRSETLTFLHYRITELLKQHHIRFAFKQLDVNMHTAIEEQQAVKFSENLAK
ncbi:mechanosensitive channel MscK [Actinobacillus equuli]|uniref:mechanosensitive channel MscK n=1 Tax=Actinobacillus equuli TaxID=718 RepID=UPI0024421096|nr:mechanosensitive channel MscK [Actinobacillus equuli]WGE66004.1 mechanosensitive channel MscK [Actinobacillus equuli subsp. equuli]WGE79934.1 mechanosensitive channel MscK [Actinobacillus equuli subsp. equuli]